MILAQIISYWLAIAFYVVSSVLYILSIKFSSSPKIVKYGNISAALGLAPNALGILLRWYQVGHVPSSQLYEVTPSIALISVMFFICIQWRYKNVAQIGAFIVPAAFLLLGLGVMGSKEITVMPATFKTYWLIIHITFAKFAYGSTLIGTVFAVCYLLKERALGVWLERLPALGKLDDLSSRFMALGFFFNTVMIFAGSIWAKNAWGSYWSWDPIETWSLIAWLFYALYLHFRRTMGWRGARASWLAIFTMIFFVFSLFGVTYFYPTVHQYFLDYKG